MRKCKMIDLRRKCEKNDIVWIKKKKNRFE